MFGPILCMYEIKTLLDQVSSVCGLPNRLDEIYLSREMVPYFVKVHLGLFFT